MIGKTAEESQADTTLLTRRVFSAPSPVRLLAPLLGVSLLSALFLTLPPLAWDTLARNFLVFATPVFASAVLTLPVIRLLGGHTYLRRTTLQAFVDACTVFGFVAVLALAELATWAAGGAPFPYDRARLLFVAFAATGWLRLAVWTVTSDDRQARSAVAAALTPAFGALAVKFAYPTTPIDDVLFVVLFSVFLAAGAVFTWAADRPLRQAFNVSGLRLFRSLLDHMTVAGEDSRRELEAFFDSFAQPAEVRTAALALRRPNAPIALIVATHAHPGPFGRAGGSDLPAKLRTALADVSPVVLVPHGPSTHDLNPATSTECLKIAEVVREVIGNGRPMPGGSRIARTTVGKATATAQFFGDVALVTASLAPNPTDDIDDATGHGAIRAAKDAGARDCLFVDAHNSADLAKGLVHFGTEESLQIIEATRRAVGSARERLAASLRVGIAEGAVGGLAQGFGAQGLQVLAVEADGQRVAYVLIDGNNMVPGLRDEVLAAVKERVNEGEVLTTDNHSVNASMGGYNPVGMRVERAKVAAAVRQLVERALADLRPAESVAGGGTVHGLRVFGHENTARLTSSVNATISVLRPMAVLTFGFALAVALVLLALVR